MLDLPCGTGRLTRMLVELGYRVTSADAAEDILGTGFADDEFDGVTCIRLFHHFYEAETRRRALSELRRICCGPIVVTFRNAFALDYLRYWLNARVRRHKLLHMLPIPMKTFAADVAAAGLQIDKKLATHWGISSRWFLVLSRREIVSNSVRSNAA